MGFFESSENEKIEKIEMLNEYLHQGGRLADITGISPKELKDIKTKSETFYRKKKYKDATELASLLVLLDGKNAEMWELLGLCLFHVNEPDLSIEALSQALRLNPTNPLPAFYLAEVVEFKLGKKHPNVLIMYRKALEICQHTCNKNDVKRHLLCKIRKLSNAHNTQH